MNRALQFCKEHVLAIVLSILFSILIAAPQVYFRIDNQELLVDGVQSIELIPDSPWSARMREVMDGHPWFGNIYNKDGKDNPYLFQPLGSMTVAYMGQVFGLDVNDTILLSRVVLSAVTFLLLYGFVFLFLRDKLLALSSATLLLFADSVLSAFGISQVLHGLSPDYFVRMARPINPAMIYILFFGFLITFWLYYRKRSWVYGVLSALLLGLNFYNYLYTWTYLYAFGGLLVLFFIFKKEWVEVKRLSYVFLGALFVGVPYVHNLYMATLHPAYEEVGARFGMVLSHAPLFVGITVMIGLAFFFIGFPKEDRERYFFGLALALAPFITMNQQIITGKILQPSHYHWFFHKPIAIICILTAVFFILSRRNMHYYKKMLAVLIISVSLIVGVFTQIESYKHDRRDGIDITIERQKYGPVMTWLQNNVEKETMVFGNNETSHLTVIYTPLNVYYHRASPFASLSSTKARQLEVLFTFYRLEGLTEADTKKRFYDERVRISGEIYGIYFREVFGSYEAIPDEKIDEVVQLYIETLNVSTEDWILNAWKKYDVEYLVWDKKVDPLWDFDRFNFLEKVAEFGELSIYHIK